MDETQNRLREVVAKASRDGAFRERLIADPAAVFATEGVTAPDGITLKVVADTQSVRHLVLPAMGGSELDEEDLTGIAAADAASGFHVHGVGSLGTLGTLPIPD